MFAQYVQCDSFKTAAIVALVVCYEFVPCYSQLMILGFGHKSRKIFFVELLTLANDTNLSDYKIETSNVVTLPKLTVHKGQLIMLYNNNPETYGFHNLASLKHLIPGFERESYVTMFHGNDCIAIRDATSNAILDIYGKTDKNMKDSCTDKLRYNNGWVGRRQCIGPSAQFDIKQWIKHSSAFSKCDENIACKDPYIFSETKCTSKVARVY